MMAQPESHRRSPDSRTGHPETSSTTSATRSWSLRRRVLITGTAVVAAFLLLVGVALEQAFRSSALDASRERLQARVYMLMGSADVDASGKLAMPETLPEPGLAIPDSGALAAVTDGNGAVLWRSDSSLATTLDYPQARTPGFPVAADAATGEGLAVFAFSYPVIWELDSGAELNLVFHAAEDQARVADAVSAFRGTLQLWLGGAGLLLLLLQAVMLSWIVRPMRRVASELMEIETGQRELLDTAYPQELRRLTDNLNGLIRSSQGRLQRYRDALSDLAHSLKTPLAVLRAGASDDLPEAQRATFLEQLDRVDETIDYQLQRAATSGRSPLSTPVDVSAATARVVASLEKVYHDKHLDISAEVAAGTTFVGDPGDLAEILGNLGDNACKWGRSRVLIKAANELGRPGPQVLTIVIEDDGPGIPEELRDAVTQRGVRADSRTPGQGIGLSVVHAMVVEIYGGRMDIGRADLGGTRVQARI